MSKGWPPRPSDRYLRGRILSAVGVELGEGGFRDGEKTTEFIGEKGAGDHKGPDQVNLTVVFQAVNRGPTVRVPV